MLVVCIVASLAHAFLEEVPAETFCLDVCNAYMALCTTCELLLRCTSVTFLGLIAAITVCELLD